MLAAFDSGEMGRARVKAADELRRRVDRVLEEAVSASRIVGGVVLVLQDGRELYRRALGFSDREAQKPTTERTIFRLASVTKPIVAALALRLIEADRMRFEAPITEYLPEFRPRLPSGEEPPITIRQLLTHTSGLSYGFMQQADGPYRRENVSDSLDQPGLSMHEELRRIVAAGLSYSPGTAWGYSASMDVLGAAIERVTRSPLPEVVKSQVTGPLHMLDTGFAAPEEARLAVPYADGKPPARMDDPHVVPFLGLSGIRFSPSRAFDAASFASGGGGMNGTANDVALFLEAMRTGGGGVVRPDTTRAMMSNHIGKLETILGKGFGFGYGGAVLVDPHAAKSPQAPGTWTWGGVWGHDWFVDPVMRFVVVAMTNTAIEGMMGRFPTDLRNAVYGVPLH